MSPHAPLNGGEDYELLFTVPIGDHAKIVDMEGVKLIGHITRQELGKMLVTRDNKNLNLKPKGGTRWHKQSTANDRTTLHIQQRQSKCRNHFFRT